MRGLCNDGVPARFFVGGVFDFDVSRHDGGPAQKRKTQARTEGMYNADGKRGLKYNFNLASPLSVQGPSRWASYKCTTCF
jgi:hypothetical protein